MGPKAAAKGGGKKKEGDPQNGGELTDAMKAQMFALTCQSLQLQLAERSEEASRAMAAKRELQSRVEQIARDFDEEQKQTFEITQDMTRQYKGMQEELLTRINKLEETVQTLSDQLADSDMKHERVLKEKNAIIDMKDAEIGELKAKMDDMAEEFGEMLKETLDKMRERIEVSSGNFDAPDLPIQHRMEEIRVSEYK
jgi:chromosome segregation ATPase